MRVLFFLLFASCFGLNVAWPVGNPKDTGGASCAGCGIGVGLLVQVAQVQSQSIADVLADVCNLFKDQVKDSCKEIVDQYGPAIIDLVGEGLGPDDVCLKIGLCKDATCHVFPSTSFTNRELSAIGGRAASDREKMESLAKALAASAYADGTALGSNPFDWFIKLAEKVFNSHLPLVDIDGDLYSPSPTFRGYNWRGQDCNIFDKDIHPGSSGRDAYGADVDVDCNGISGTDRYGTPYEEKFCSNTTSRFGVVALGDSATAHFHIPPEYLTPSKIGKSTFDTILDVASNEGDWPHLSGYTGYVEDNDTEHCPGPVNSFYMNMRNWNRCNHRDYQNIGVNGARISHLAGDHVGSMARSKEDQPAIAFIAFVGNDVCNGHPDTISHMTTEEEWTASLIAGLDALDQKLPNGSKVVVGGTIDGRVLWDNLHDKPHPFGETVTVLYEDIYRYLSCLGLSPCVGWLNDNATLRDFTSERNAAFDVASKNVVSQKQGQYSFDLYFVPCPVNQVISDYKAKGGKVTDLIEPVDGFHPSQIANALTAQYTWQFVQENIPELIGEENPNNADIINTFGDQGGY